MKLPLWQDWHRGKPSAPYASGPVYPHIRQLKAASVFRALAISSGVILVPFHGVKQSQAIIARNHPGPFGGNVGKGKERAASWAGMGPRSKAFTKN